MNQIIVEAVFENGVFRPSQPISLPSPQAVTLIVQVPNEKKEKDWPPNVAQIYQDIAEEDRRLAAAMFEGIRSTWPTGEESP